MRRSEFMGTENVGVMQRYCKNQFLLKQRSRLGLLSIPTYIHNLRGCMERIKQQQS